jgi:hypothetical protein
MHLLLKYICNRAGKFNIRIIPFIWLAHLLFVMASLSTFVYSDELFGFMAKCWGVFLLCREC